MCASAVAGSSAVADSSNEPRLPTVVNAPGTWSDATGPAGTVAAVGIATRTSPVGLFDEHETLAHFTTSALDGSSSWLELPGFSLDQWGFVGGVAVSPNGRWLAWVRVAGRPDAAEPYDDLGQIRAGIAGWSILDTTTGSVRELAVEGFDRVRPTMADLAFSGDSKFLLTSFETPDQPRTSSRAHQFVAWGVSDGTPHVLEDPGFYWLPSLGSAEHGVVWSRRNRVFRADPETGHRSEVDLPRTVLMASWAPGDAGFAYIGRDAAKRGSGPKDQLLYVGLTPATADRVVELPESSPIGEFLAWRDSTHLVLGDYRRSVYVVDITDGSHEVIDMAGYGKQVNTPNLATALWSEPMRAPRSPTGTTDPRRPWRWAGFTVSVLMLGGVVLARRRGPAASAKAR